MRRRARHWTPVGVAFVVAGALAGGVVASQLRGFDDPEGLFAAIREDPVVRVAEIPAAGGAPAHGVFAQVTSTGHFCLWDAPSPGSRQRRGGCNSLEDPLGGRKLSVSLAYDGGPRAADVTDARLFGIAAVDVARVEVLMSDGTRRRMILRNAAVDDVEFRVFGHGLARGELRRGVGPVAVVALDAAGQEVDRQATGFGG